jgi:hypothetical protein
MTTFRRALVAASIMWAALLPLAPFAASQPAPAPFWYGLAFVAYGAGSFICHQLPARSFHGWLAQWPVCARCTGIYFGAAMAAVVATVRLPPSPLRGFGVPGKPDTTYETVRLKPDTTYITRMSTRRARGLLVAAALPTAVTLLYEWTTGDTPSNAIRALAGAPLGAAVAVIVIEALRIQAAGRR